MIVLVKNNADAAFKVLTLCEGRQKKKIMLKSCISDICRWFLGPSLLILWNLPSHGGHFKNCVFQVMYYKDEGVKTKG